MAVMWNALRKPTKCGSQIWESGREERKNKKCRPCKSRKEETVEKMGANGCPGNPQKGDNH